MEPEDLETAYPFMNAYTALMQCKNLGLTISADAFDLDTVEALHTIQQTIDETQSKKKAKG